MIPRIGEAIRPDRRYRQRDGAYAVLLRDGAALMTFQAEPDFAYQLPGGGIDAGESPLRALYREVLEETGWSISRPVRLGAFRRFTYLPDHGYWAEKVCRVYLARPVRRLGPPSEPGHLAVWASLETAVDMVGNPGDRMFLSRFL